MATLPLAYWLFLTALGLGCTLGLGALFEGGGTATDADLDGDADVELDADAPDAELDADADADGDAHGTDADGSVPVETFWSALGIGRVPVGLLLSLDLMLFGGIGLVVSELGGVLLPVPVASWLAFGVAAVAGPLFGGRLARAIARRLPGVESHGVSRLGLVGRLGHAELDIDARFGRARVIDAGGAVHLVRCTSSTGVIPRGRELVITDCDPKTGIFEVVSADLELGPPPQRASRVS